MIDFLASFDGTGRPPRKVQADGLNWLTSNWTLKPVSAINGPVGCGKSAMVRAVQKATNGAGIIPSNLLINQVSATYPKVNFLKGKTHYSCSSGLTCSEWCDGLEQDPCLDCPYQDARARAGDGEATFFNPMSLWYLRRRLSDFKPRAILVDEAHQLPGMLMQLASKRFPQSVYKFTEDCANEVKLESWMTGQIGKLKKLVTLYQNNKDSKKVSEILSEIDSIGMTLEGVRSDPQNYAVYLEQGVYRRKPEIFLNVRPIRTPSFIVRQLLNCDKLVLLSGTLLKTDIEELAAGREWDYLDLPSPIPKDRRPVVYRPMAFPVNYETPPAKMVAWIEEQIRAYPNRNTIIHTTYDRVRKWGPLFKLPIISNTAENKIERLEYFKRYGGIFLAAGCAEGIDLADDLCRLNIIPHLVYPNLGDPVVKKRKALADGDSWYELETLKTTIQQYGRSTRHPKDESVTIVGDPRFSQLVHKRKKELPRYFYEAIRWTSS